jgi:DNA-binding SARP family transcriptional activator/TolB-like protein
MHSLQLLGGAVLANDAGPVTGPATQRHRIALLALLASAPTEWTPRDKLLAMLWPERDTEHARNLLNQAVHALRRALGEAAIQSQGDSLRLDPSLLHTDLAAFESAISRGDLAAAAERYRGPFLDGFFLPDSAEFERWTDDQRLRLAREYQELLETLAREAEAAGRVHEALRSWRLAAGEDPLNARLAVAYMDALAAAGDRAGAIQHARVHSQLLALQLGAEPDPEVAALAERLRSAPEARAVALADAPEPAPPAPVVAQDPHPRSGPPLEVSTPSSAPTRRPRPRRAGGVMILGLALLGVLAIRPGLRPAPTAPGPVLQRVAVLPPGGSGASSEQQHFTDGMHDALISELGRVPGLAVISRQSVLEFQGSSEPLPVIAARLGVDHIVEASAFRVGDSVRVSVALVRVDPEEALWTGEFHGTVGGALALQREAATAIARAIEAEVGRPATPVPLSLPNVHAQAQDAYFRGRYELDRQAGIGPMPRAERDSVLVVAVGHFKEALRIEPDWAEAHARLASTYHWMGSGFPPRPSSDSFFTLSEAAAERALALDADNSTAHAALGFVRFYWELDFAGGETLLRRAVALEPSAEHHEILAMLLMSAGRVAEALPLYDLAAARNPLSERLNWSRLAAYDCAGRDEDALRLAEAHVERFREIITPVMPGIHSFRAHAYSWLGLHEQAVRQQELSVGLSDRLPVQMANLAFMLARAGRHPEARQILADLDATGSTPAIPQLFAALGDTARALAFYEEWARAAPRAFALRLHCTVGYRLLGPHPRVRELLRESIATVRAGR